MNWNRVDLKERGKTAFKANYWKCVLVSLVMAMISGGAGNSSTSSLRKNLKESDFSDLSSLGGLGKDIFSSSAFAAGLAIAGIVIFIVALIILALGIAASIFALNPLEMGCQRFFLDNAFDSQASPKQMGWAFRCGYYKNVVITMFLRNLYTTLWTLLLIVPGIIKTYEYRMIPYLLAEDPAMPTEEAFQRSKQMMDGQKWNAFVLDLSFIGWHLLSGITLGILGVFYVGPYVHATNAELYLTLKSGNIYSRTPQITDNTFQNNY